MRDQKLYVIINWDRNKGRDFYDLVFLMGRDIKPNYKYLEAKVSITNEKELKEAVLDKCQQLDMDAMAKDVGSFLFDASEVKKVTRFEDVVRQYEF
jgi:hypothetical protein